MMKRNTGVAIRSSPLFSISLAVFLVVAWMIQQRSAYWDRVVNSHEDKLLATFEALRIDPPYQWSQVPPVVQRYLHKVFQKDFDFIAGINLDTSAPPTCTKISWPASVSLRQGGDFLLRDDEWFPYEARETLSPQGFVWVARMSALELARSSRILKFLSPLLNSRSFIARWIKDYIEPFFTVWIVDIFHLNEPSFALISWMKGVAAIVDSTPPNPEFADQLEVGEAVRWLAEAVMLPSAYLPASSRVVWKPHPDDENKAVLVLNVPNESNVAKVQLTATFDERTAFLTRVQGDRPFLERPTKTFRVRSWFATFENYEWNDEEGLWHPTSMEAGWMSDDDEGGDEGPELSVAVRASQAHVRYTHSENSQ